MSAEAATRSADLAEVVEAGRHHGWRVEPRHNPDVYVLPNVGTVNARNVTLTGEFHIIDFAPRVDAVDIEAGQAQFFQVMQTLGDAGGQIHITWTPDMPDAQPLTWTESLPIPVFRPRLDAHDLSKAIEKLAQ